MLLHRREYAEVTLNAVVVVVLHTAHAADAVSADDRAAVCKPDIATGTYLRAGAAADAGVADRELFVQQDVDLLKPLALLGKELVFRRCARAFAGQNIPGDHLGLDLHAAHGGGFIRGRTSNDELFCKILDLDYKIAPDYPFPAAVHEAYRTLRWVYENAAELDIDPKRIVLMGHSAGGNLCIGAIMRSLELGTEIPELLVCEYPPLDIYTDPGEKKTMGKGLPAARARLYNLYYCDRELQKDPYCSPTYAPDEMLLGFPPTLMITGACDDLCNEAEDFALRLARYLRNMLDLK